MELFSVGHSNYEMETFISLLRQHEITAVADVRSHPYSRFLPHFNQVALKEYLAREGIRYVFLGQELGARPSNQECYFNGKAVYEKIASTDLFHEGIQRILKGLKKYRISLMCAEKDPITCHRAILVCRYLRHFNFQINHILKDGDLETHTHLEERMLIKHGFREFSEIQKGQAQLSLFAQPEDNLPTKEECLERAYQLQGNEIAYVDKRNDVYEQTSQSIHNRVHSKERSKVF
ncbi:DUF488 family protein [Pantanalinema rosaneae CENA516]|uniref:DUF488 domain-containing protein n=1 Tax=Pantanalinema rosaneae TaxID=1620701 RepID=UPI003D6F7345